MWEEDQLILLGLFGFSNSLDASYFILFSSSLRYSFSFYFKFKLHYFLKRFLKARCSKGFLMYGRAQNYKNQFVLASYAPLLSINYLKQWIYSQGMVDLALREGCMWKMRKQTLRQNYSFDYFRSRLKRSMNFYLLPLLKRFMSSSVRGLEFFSLKYLADSNLLFTIKFSSIIWIIKFNLHLIRIINLTMLIFTNKFTVATTQAALRLPSFKHFSLYPKILTALDQKQIHTPSYIQYALLTKINQSKQNFQYHIVSPTGSGKTLAYMIPMIDHLKKQQEQVGSRLTQAKKPRGLIITSNKELVLQTRNVGKMLSHTCKLKCEGLGIGRNIVQEQTAIDQGLDILVSTYSRFSRMQKMKKLFLSRLEWIVVDEFDTLFEGEKTKTEQIIQNLVLPQSNKKHMNIVLSSTTNPANFSNYIKQKLPNMTQVIDKQTHVNLQNIKHQFLHSPNYDKHQPLTELLYRDRKAKTMIFCNTVESLHELQYFLCAQGFQVLTLHSHLNKQTRLKNYEHFRDKEDGILLSTDLGGRGLDFPNLKRIINYDFPLTTCDYLQRAGRTGRAGSKGNVISLYFKKDLEIINQLKGASFKEPLKIKNSAYGFKNREETGRPSKYK